MHVLCVSCILTLHAQVGCRGLSGLKPGSQMRGPNWVLQGSPFMNAGMKPAVVSKGSYSAGWAVEDGWGMIGDALLELGGGYWDLTFVSHVLVVILLELVGFTDVVRQPRVDCLSLSGRAWQKVGRP